MPYDNNNNERGFDRENRSERNFDSNREGGYNRGGYNSNREGGFNNNREGGFNREGGGGYNREGGFNRGGGGGFNREGGGGYNREGGFNRGGGGGFNREGGGGYNREGGFGNRGGFEGGEGGFDKQEIVHSEKVRAGNRRTYFMDIKKTRGDDFFLTITESTKNFNGYTRHKIFLYKEDVNRFVESLNKVVEHLKTELMPEYDFDEFARRYEEGAENNEEGGDGPRYRRNEGGYDSANDRSFGSSEASEDAPTSSYSKPEETAADDDDDTWKD